MLALYSDREKEIQLQRSSKNRCKIENRSSVGRIFISEELSSPVVRASVREHRWKQLERAADIKPEPSGEGDEEPSGLVEEVEPASQDAPHARTSP